MVYSGKVEDGPIKKALDSGRCPRCLCHLEPVDVHGHQQCSVCKFYIVECCNGELASSERTCHTHVEKGVD